MKPLIPLLLLILFASCTKSNITIHHRYQVQEAHDRTTWDHAFCAEFGKIDTVELTNTAAYDSSKFGVGVGSILFHIPNGRVPTDIPGIWDRYYFKILMEIN